jgi:hypothetical protein
LVIGFTALLASIAAIIVFALWRKKVLRKKNEGKMRERLDDSNISTEYVILDLCNFFIFFIFFLLLYVLSSFSRVVIVAEDNLDSEDNIGVCFYYYLLYYYY